MKMIYHPFSVLIVMLCVLSITKQQKMFQQRLNRKVFYDSVDQQAAWDTGRQKPRLFNVTEAKDIESSVPSRYTEPMNNYGSILSGAMSKDLVKQISDYLYTLLKSPAIPRSSTYMSKQKTSKQYHHTNTVEEYSSEEDYEAENSSGDEQVKKQPRILQSVSVKKLPSRVIRNRALGVSRSIMIRGESRLKDDPIAEKSQTSGQSKRIEGRS